MVRGGRDKELVRIMGSLLYIELLIEEQKNSLNGSNKVEPFPSFVLTAQYRPSPGDSRDGRSPRILVSSQD